MNLRPPRRDSPKKLNAAQCLAPAWRVSPRRRAARKPRERGKSRSLALTPPSLPRLAAVECERKSEVHYLVELARYYGRKIPENIETLTPPQTHRSASSSDRGRASPPRADCHAASRTPTSPRYPRTWFWPDTADAESPTPSLPQAFGSISLPVPCRSQPPIPSQTPCSAPSNDRPGGKTGSFTYRRHRTT